MNRVVIPAARAETYGDLFADDAICAGGGSFESVLLDITCSTPHLETRLDTEAFLNGTLIDTEWQSE